MKEVVVTRDELQILLNMEDEVSVMYPFYPHFQLFTAIPEEESYKLKVLTLINRSRNLENTLKLEKHFNI